MNKTDAEKMLLDAKSDLSRIQREYDALQAIISGCEQWLGLNGSKINPAPGVLPLEANKPSLRGTILAVLKESGQPLHVRKIYERVLARGASSTAKEPLGIIDLTVIGWIKTGEVRKTSPRTYQYVKDRKS